jgi:hypothetical protein
MFLRVSLVGLRYEPSELMAVGCTPLEFYQLCLQFVSTISQWTLLSCLSWLKGHVRKKLREVTLRMASHYFETSTIKRTVC